MKRLMMLVALVSGSMCVTGQNAFGEYPFYFPPPVYNPQANYPFSPPPIFNPQPNFPAYPPPMFNPQPIYPPPGVRFIPPTFSGYNPATGGWNSQSAQVNNSVYTPFRNTSVNNGSMIPVNQPVYNPNGQVVGWQQGVQWKNSVTGQQHFNTNVITPNGTGGVNSQRGFGLTGNR